MRFHEFLRRAAITTPAVVVPADEVALGIVRDLGREGVPVLVMGPDRNSAAFRSRYCAATTCADPHLNEEQFIEDVVAVGEMLPQRGVLCPAHDDYAIAASRHREQLTRGYIVPVPEWERMRDLADKELQMRLAWRAGVQTPITAFIKSSEDLQAGAGQVPFPAVLKSAAPMALVRRTGLKAVRLDSTGQLAEAYERFAYCGSLLLQEVIPGGDDDLWIAGCYHDAQSRPLAVFTGRKLRQHPRGFGVGRLGESKWRAEVADAALGLLAEARYHGVSDVEFKWDSRDGRFKLMEVNARQGFWGPLATASGVNLSYIAYLDSIGSSLESTVQRDGVRWVDLLRDGPDSLAELLRRELTMREWLEPLLRVRADAFFSLRDPWPGLCEMKELGVRFVKREARRLTS